MDRLILKARKARSILPVPLVRWVPRVRYHLLVRWAPRVRYRPSVPWAQTVLLVQLIL